MKVYSLLVIIAIIVGINSNLTGFQEKTCREYQHNRDEDFQAYSKDFCRTLKLRYNYYKCCYVRYKEGDNNYFNCHELTLSEFYDIKATKRALESIYGDIKDIICDSSSFLRGSLLLLLFFLF